MIAANENNRVNQLITLIQVLESKLTDEKRDDLLDAENIFTIAASDLQYSSGIAVTCPVKINGNIFKLKVSRETVLRKQGKKDVLDINGVYTLEAYSLNANSPKIKRFWERKSYSWQILSKGKVQDSLNMEKAKNYRFNKDIKFRETQEITTIANWMLEQLMP